MQLCVTPVAMLTGPVTGPDPCFCAAHPWVDNLEYGNVSRHRLITHKRLRAMWGGLNRHILTTHERLRAMWGGSGFPGSKKLQIPERNY
eukprot:1316939-Amorphochlora_amoeboformis.AAC.1